MWLCPLQLLIGMMRQQQHQQQLQLQQDQQRRDMAVTKKRKMSGVDEEVAKQQQQQQQQQQPAWASVCKSACSGRANPCSAEAVAVGKWSVGQVCDFVTEIDACEPFAEVRNLSKIQYKISQLSRFHTV